MGGGRRNWNKAITQQEKCTSSKDSNRFYYLKKFFFGHWVSCYAGFSLIVVRRGYSFFSCRLVAVEPSCCRALALDIPPSEVAAHDISSEACGIFLDQNQKPLSSALQSELLITDHQGIPKTDLLIEAKK